MAKRKARDGTLSHTKRNKYVPGDRLPHFQPGQYENPYDFRGHSPPFELQEHVGAPHGRVILRNHAKPADYINARNLPQSLNFRDVSNGESSWRSHPVGDFSSIVYDRRHLQKLDKEGWRESALRWVRRNPKIALALATSGSALTAYGGWRLAQELSSMGFRLPWESRYNVGGMRGTESKEKDLREAYGENNPRYKTPDQGGGSSNFRQHVAEGPETVLNEKGLREPYEKMQPIKISRQSFGDTSPERGGDSANAPGKPTLKRGTSQEVPRSKVSAHDLWGWLPNSMKGETGIEIPIPGGGADPEVLAKWEREQLKNVGPNRIEYGWKLLAPGVQTASPYQWCSSAMHDVGVRGHGWRLCYEPKD